jgi:hypothetical protein
MKLPDFYENRWVNIGYNKETENDVDYLDYIRVEYELWALWIDKFYSGKKNGIYNKIEGDAPRYALEDDFDFWYWKDDYRENFKNDREDHRCNHRVRSSRLINRLNELFEKVDNYVPKVNEDRDYLSLEEMSEKMMIDPMYKKKWFQAAYDANIYMHRKIKRDF